MTAEAAQVENLIFNSAGSLVITSGYEALAIEGIADVTIIDPATGALSTGLNLDTAAEGEEVNTVRTVMVEFLAGDNVSVSIADGETLTLDGTASATVC